MSGFHFSRFVGLGLDDVAAVRELLVGASAFGHLDFAALLVPTLTHDNTAGLQAFVGLGCGFVLMLGQFGFDATNLFRFITNLFVELGHLAALFHHGLAHGWFRHHCRSGCLSHTSGITHRSGRTGTSRHTTHGTPTSHQRWALRSLSRHHSATGRHHPFTG